MLSVVVDNIYLLQIASKAVEDNIEIHMSDKEITYKDLERPTKF
jgi:hypothetical protein